MKPKLLRLLVSLLLSAVILYLLYRKVDFPEFSRGLGSVDLPWLLLLIPGALIVTALRGIRWGYLAGWDQGAAAAVRALFISRAGNNLLPFRVGDLLRMQFARDEGGVSYSASSAAILAEMVIDIGFLCVFGTLLFVLTVTHGEVAVATAGAALITLLFLWLLTRESGGSEHSGGISLLLFRFRRQLRRAFSIQRLPRALLLSSLIWLASFGSVYGGLRLMLPEVSLAGLLCAVVLIFFAAMIPSAPGFVGTYHAAVAGAIVFMGFDFQSFSALPVVMHLSQFIVQVIAGLLVGYSYIFRNDWKKAREGMRSVRTILLGTK